MARKVQWGIIGTGGIAGAFAKALRHSRTGELLAVGSRKRETAGEFAAKYNVPRTHAPYDSLLADADVDAVYISTPHPMHAEWAIKAAEAGKHILCEKPLAMNYPEAMAIVEAARENDVFLMEAFMYRCHPQTARLVRLIRDGAIGQVRVIQAAFSFHAAFDETSRLLDPALGGGGILDVGCYCVSMARLVVGAALGKDFEDPVEVKGIGRIGVTGVDEWAAACLKFPGDIVALVSTGVQVSQENVVRVYGSEGQLVVPNPWIVSREGGASSILLYRGGHSEPERIRVTTKKWLYAIEADTVARFIKKRKAPSPAMSVEDSLGNMKTLDRWREEIGLAYPCERAEGMKLTFAKRPLAVRRAVMKYGRVDGVDKKVSKVFIGTMAPRTLAHAAALYDDFFERGGNAFDTAYVYRSGRSEALLGQWIRLRGVRDEVVVLAKGAHTPNCYPEALTRELSESLERLQTGYADIYMLHRDNPEVPVGEFVDVLNEHKRAGRIRAFGGSNWTVERIEAANAYAREKGLTGFVAVSNNFSLAEMIKPVWAGCLSFSGPEARAWLSKTRLPIIAWSSQARGFFTDRSSPEDTSDAELVDSWYSEDNFRRKQRAIELARASPWTSRALHRDAVQDLTVPAAGAGAPTERRAGPGAGHRPAVLPINVALAYVLCQPFEAFAIIGPETVHETATALQALQVSLTGEEIAWLNLER